MRFDTFKRHDFFQSFASIGRVDLVYSKITLVTQREDPNTAMATPLMNYRAVHSSMEILPPSFDEGTKDGFLLIGLGD